MSMMNNAKNEKLRLAIEEVLKIIKHEYIYISQEYSRGYGNTSGIKEAKDGCKEGCPACILVKALEDTK